MFTQVDNNTNPTPKPRKGKRPHGNAPSFDLRSELYRMTGTDLTQIDGVTVVTAQAILADTGTDMSAWRTEKDFVSWFGLCPTIESAAGWYFSEEHEKWSAEPCLCFLPNHRRSRVVVYLSRNR